jgi:hypothetical protein
MPIVISPAGEAKALGLIVASENFTLKLYTACATAGGLPSSASIVGDFTEATFTGYTAKTLTGSLTGTTWSTPSGTPAQTQYNASTPQSWTATGGYQTILGYYYVGATSGTFWGAESYIASGGTSVVMSASQPTTTLVPTLKLGTNPAPTS